MSGTMVSVEVPSTGPGGSKGKGRARSESVEKTSPKKKLVRSSTVVASESEDEKSVEPKVTKGRAEVRIPFLSSKENVLISFVVVRRLGNVRTGSGVRRGRHEGGGGSHGPGRLRPGS